MCAFENPTPTRPPLGGSPLPTPDGSVSAFRQSTDTSALRALQTIVEPGTEINGFVVDRLLGRGGVAAVYNGREKETGREVALKILDARFTADPELVSRFLAEGDALAKFDHPNIVQHIDHGQDETFAYIAMELIHGITLDQLIHAIKIEPRHVLRLAREISKGLTTIHAAGLVHGDVKPSNILVTRPGDVKISDFGTAALSNVARSGATKVSGTAVYIAPERVDAARPVDYRADIFSLGVTFYKVLTGKTPGDTWTPPTSLNPELPDGVDEVLQRAMDIDPEKRFITVKELCDRLAALFDKSAPITPVSSSYTKAEQAAAETAAASHSKKKAAESGIDWKMVVLCALAAIGLAATLIVLGVFFGRW